MSRVLRRRMLVVLAPSGGPVSPPPPPGSSLADNFSGATNTLLIDHTADTGQPWTVYDISGTTVFKLDGASNVDGDVSLVATETVSVAIASAVHDGKIQIGGVKGPQIGGLVFRFSDANNFWVLRMNYPANAVELVKREAGVSAVVTSTGIQGSQTNPAMTVGLSGATISGNTAGGASLSVSNNFNEYALGVGLYIKIPTLTAATMVYQGSISAV